MGRLITIGSSLLCATGLSTAALLGLGISEASARVGVTSATDGDPLGKPPDANERVLRIGIDVQADETVTTHSNDRAHLVFLDGTSLTVGPNATVKIDKFVYDPATKQGDLAVTASQGVFRLVGGRISKTNAITINTPSGTIGIRGGITVFDVKAFETIAAFIFGNSMSFNHMGHTETAIRPGSWITCNRNAPPGPPGLIPPGGIAHLFAQFENGTPGGSGGGADGGAQKFGQNNQPPGSIPPGTGAPINPPNNPYSNGNNPPSGVPQNAQPPSTSAGQTGTRTTQNLLGFANGLVKTGRNTVIPAPLLSTGINAAVATNVSTNTTTASIVITSLDGTLFGPNTTLNVGGTTNNSTFVDDSKYSASATNASTTINPIFGRSQQATQTTTVASAGDGSQTPTIPTEHGGLPSCAQCTFLSWGWWSTTITPTGFGSQVSTVTSAPYVVGVPVTNMPMTGSATFTGFMTGNVLNNGSAYSATGSYSSTWSFASRAGNFNASFDGTNYSGGAIATNSSGTTFAGVIGGGGKIGTLNGAFFGSGAVNQAGSFGIAGSNYKAAGVFAGSSTTPAH